MLVHQRVKCWWPKRLTPVATLQLLRFRSNGSPQRDTVSNAVISCSFHGPSGGFLTAFPAAILAIWDWITWPSINDYCGRSNGGSSGLCGVVVLGWPFRIDPAVLGCHERDKRIRGSTITMVPNHLRFVGCWSPLFWFLLLLLLQPQNIQPAEGNVNGWSPPFFIDVTLW